LEDIKALNLISGDKKMTDTNEVVAVAVDAPSKDDCNIALLAHLLGIFTGFVGPLIIWLLKKDSSRFVAEESKEALNFQITMALAYIVSALLFIIVIGIILMPILMVLNIIFCIVGAMAASKGNHYKYPFAIRLIK